jgi:undecaprenyl-diphosphatase
MIRSKPLLFSQILLFFFLFAAGAGAATQGTPPPSSSSHERSAMTFGQAMILGVVEGLTEYLPVSSTGHLLLAERMLGIGNSPSLSTLEAEHTKEASDAYTICIQAGAIIAVLGLYFRRIKQMTLGAIGKDPAGFHLLGNVAAGFLPAAVIGLLFNKIIKTYLFGPWPVVAAWLVGGTAILAVARWKKRNNNSTRNGMTLDGLTWRMALIIGFAQCIAMWPGVSRSLVTIVGGVLVGLSLPAAVEYSFLLGVVTLGAATAYDSFKHGQVMLQTFDAASLIVGVAFAFIAAVLSVKWMVAYLNRHGLSLFGWYRVAVALVAAVLIATNRI